MKNSIKYPVVIVGAGPGDPELITVKGYKALQNADVILFDALVNKDILSDLDKSIELIYVGKRNNLHHFTQDEIHTELLYHVFQGKKVVRLKGGDPFVFGRAHEEIEFLEAFGIKTQVIAGISSVTGGPANINLPLTRRGISQSFWAITATKSDGQLSDDIEISSLSNATKVILMGTKKIKEIQAVFINNKQKDTPVAFLENASMPKERLITTSVKEMHQSAIDNKLTSPALIIIGDVVNCLKQNTFSDAINQLNFN